MENTNCSRVILSAKAHLSIVAETYERVGTETGGILLGKIVGDIWYVVEVIDPGPNSIFRPSYFEYDTPYVNHLSKKVARFYKEGVSLLGLWHRHPGSFDKFSSTDDGTNTEYASQTPRGAISAIINLDPQFRMTVYHVSLPLQYNRVAVDVGDHLIPENLLALKDLRDFIPNQQRTRSTSQAMASQTSPSGQPNPVENFFTSMGKMVSSLVSAPQSTEQQPISKPEATQAQEVILEMLDGEMDYLESQPDYEYKIAMRGDEVHVAMTYVQAMPYYPLDLNCVFSVSENGEQWATINGQKMPYKRGIIRWYVNSAAAEASHRETNQR